VTRGKASRKGAKWKERFPPQLTRRLGKLSQWDRGRAPAAKAFIQFLVAKTLLMAAIFTIFV